MSWCLGKRLEVTPTCQPSPLCSSCHPCSLLQDVSHSPGSSGRCCTAFKEPSTPGRAQLQSTSTVMCLRLKIHALTCLDSKSMRLLTWSKKSAYKILGQKKVSVWRIFPLFIHDFHLFIHRTLSIIQFLFQTLGQLALSGVLKATC